jgi:CubicO group peptidase (beta-lactamase class C family)
MLAEGGALDGRRVLTPETLKLMTTDQLGPGVDRKTFPYRDGGGFGLGFGLAPVDVGGKHAAKVWTWGGSDGTDFWVDPTNGVFAVYMIQNAREGGRLNGRFRKSVYEALR